MKRPKDILSQPYHIQEYINYLEKKNSSLHSVGKCTCEIPDPRMKNSENGISGYCVKCVKPLW